MLFLQGSYKPAVATSFKMLLANCRSQNALQAPKRPGMSSVAGKLLWKAIQERRSEQGATQYPGDGKCLLPIGKKEKIEKLGGKRWQQEKKGKSHSQPPLTSWAAKTSVISSDLLK